MPRRSVLTNTSGAPSWTLLHLALCSELSRRSCARASRTCCFRLPEQMDIISALCSPSQTNDLSSPFPAFLTPWYIPPSPSLLPPTCRNCLRDTNESKLSLLAWIAVSVWELLFLHCHPLWNRADAQKRNYSQATSKTLSLSFSSFVSAPIHSLIWMHLLAVQREQNRSMASSTGTAPKRLQGPVFSPWSLTPQATP